MRGERGNTLIGIVVGLILGLAIAVAVALYLTRAPVPFVNRSLRATENVKPGADGKLPDPNQPLYAKPVEPPKADAKADARTDPKAAPPPPEKGAPPDAAAAETSRYLLQAGAFRSPDDADAMRARLALLGLEARVYPAEQGGTTWYRVRLGPYGQIDDLNRIRKELAENGIDSTIVRVK
ncbi:MAG: SPOR domain-containing protein [Burkholderiaceae bacterium]|nr:SPOR domain-containing protein [Burkholderiaceae bacterium]MCX8005746.1 SPOR domain-containing protein [Burkholderiaceae bacterium]